MPSLTELLKARVTRRGVFVIAGSAVVTACVGPATEPISTPPPATEESPKPTISPSTPTGEQQIYPSPVSTAARPFEQPTPPPKPEIINQAGTELTERFLTKGLTGIGGEEIVLTPVAGGTGKEVRGFPGEQFDYARLTWGSADEFVDLATNPMADLRFLLSFGQAAGFKGETYDISEVFPQLTNLRFFRFSLNEQEEQAPEGFFPEGLIVRGLSNLTIVGIYKEDNKGWVVISFDEGFDRSQKGIAAREIPRQYWAIVPQPWLKEALEKSGQQLADGQLAYTVAGKNYLWQVNTINQGLFEILKAEAGVFWVDRRPGNGWYENPVVPYPPQELAGVKTLKTAEGKLVTQDANGKLVAEAVFNEKTKKWEWQKTPPPTPEVKKEAPVPDTTEWGLRWDNTEKVYVTIDKRYGLPEGSTAGVYAAEKYFVNGEARIGTVGLKRQIVEKLQTEAMAKGELVTFLPLDPRGMEIEINVGVSPYDPEKKKHFLGLNGLKVGTPFYAPGGGEFLFFTKSQAPDRSWIQLAALELEGKKGILALVFKDMKVLVPNLHDGEKKVVAIGTLIVSLGSDKKVPFFPGNSEVAFDYWEDENTVGDLTVDNLLQTRGRLVFLLPD